MCQLQQACTNLATALLVVIVTTSLHSWLDRPFATSEFIRTVSVNRQYFTVTNSVIIKTMVTQLPLFARKSCLVLRPRLLPHSNPIINLTFVFVKKLFTIVNFMAFRVGSKPNIKPLCLVYSPPPPLSNLKPNLIKPVRDLGPHILISQKLFICKSKLCLPETIY